MLSAHAFGCCGAAWGGPHVFGCPDALTAEQEERREAESEWTVDLERAVDERD